MPLATGLLLILLAAPARAASTATLFTTQTPSPSNWSPGTTSIELGVRFVSDVPGNVTAIRFYKRNDNTGTHTGHLWTSAGQLLGSVTFTGETSSGWQTAAFSAPIPVSSGVVYIASYHTTKTYQVTRSYFVSQFDHPPLHAPADAASAHDGVYAYGTGAVFPTQGTQASNWWADLVLSYETGPPPNLLPSISGLSPSSATVGSPALALTVLGAGFISSSTALWNGQARPTTFLGASQLGVAVSSADLAAAATDFVSVFNPAPGGGTSTAAGFLVGNPLPQIAALSPSSAMAGAQGFSLAVAGSGFVSTSTVLWNGGPLATSRPSSTTLSAFVPAGDLASTGTAAVSVFNGAPGGGLSDPSTFTIVPPPAGSTGPWTAAYYTGWQTTWLPISQVDLGAVDALIHFAIKPNSDGTLDATQDSITPTAVAAFVSAVHGAGKKALFCIGGAASQSNFESAMGPANLAAFVDNLVSFMTAGGYDGIDVDMEPMSAADAALYAQFVQALRAKMDSVQPGSLLTAAADSQPQIFAQLSGPFDHVDVLTYVLAGTYTGQTWHDSAIFSPSSTTLQSMDSLIRQFEAAGVPAAKLGGAIDFDGFVWTGGSGVTGPYQHWTSAPTAVETPYYSIADKYGLTEGDTTNPLYRWDFVAQAPYLSVAGATASDDAFIPFNDTVIIQRKFDYARFRGLGGMIVWNLADGYRPNLPAGQQDLLLQAVKSARFSPPPNPSPSISSMSPSSVQAGSGAFTLALKGAGFTLGSAALWNGSSRPTTFVSTGDLAVQIASTDVTAAGTAAVAVSNPAPGGGVSSGAAFTIGSSSVSPDVASILPSSAAAGGPGFTLQVFGSGFISSSTVFWNGQSRPTIFVGSSALTASILAADVAAPQTASVAVFNPDGSGQSNSAAFVVYSTAPAPSTTTIFTTQVPASSDWSSGSSSIELGVRFVSDVPGQVAGVRFYKKSNNTGAHTGHLWTSTGALLGSATFTGETDSGWQTALFTTPISISSGVAYVASYHTPNTYQVTRNYFSSQLDHPPLHALADASSAHDGGYAYGTSAVFPSQGTQASNWWADVLFAPGPAVAAASLRAPASAPGPAAATDLDSVRVYPNPWRADRHGGLSVTVDGLTPESTVRIYTISGRWVRTLDASGGAIKWDLDNGSGQKVSSGIYLYIISDPYGRRVHGTLGVVR